MAQVSKGRNISAWILCTLLGAVYVLAGLPKLGLFSQEMVSEVTENFRRYGHADGFRMFIGAVEVAGGLGLLIPRLGSLAALGLMIVMGGAVYTHLAHGEAPQAIGPIVLLSLLALSAWLRRPQLLAGSAQARAGSGRTRTDEETERSAA